MAGGAGSEGFGSWQNWTVALITLAVVIFCNHLQKGVFKLASILIGMVVGYIVALAMGMVSFSAVAQSGWFAVTAPLHFGITFNASACISLAVMYIVNSVQTIGDLTSTTIGGLDREPTDRELSGGIVAQGVRRRCRCIFGGLPAATFSQNGNCDSQPRRQPDCVRICGVRAARSRLCAEVRVAADNDSAVRHRRRDHLGVRHHHDDRHPYDPSAKLTQRNVAIVGLSGRSASA